MINYERELVRELSMKGYSYYDVYSIFKKKQLLPEEVEIILKWLPFIYSEHEGTGDTLVRSLRAAKEPFNPTTLIE